MRYERVQEILENEPAFRNRLSPKTHPVQTRFGEKVMFSKETVDITEALHSEGKDAHKVPKNDVLKAAARILRVIAGNGESIPVMPVAAPPKPVEPASPARKPRVKPLPAPPPEPEPSAPVAIKAKPKAKKKPEAAPIARTPVPQPEAKPVRVNKPEPVKPAPQAVVAAPVEEEPVPESELPPEKQPLRLPRDFDPSQFPHYSVQTSIYALLLSALNLGEHYEKFPGAEARHKKLEDVMKDYLSTCDALKLKTT